jgi:hypothetical protein
MAFQKRRPAPRANAGNWAKVCSAPANTISTAEAETFAAAYVGRRFRLSPSLARVVAMLAQLGGRLA